MKMPKKEEEERDYVMVKGRGDAEQNWKACPGEKQGYLFALERSRMGSDDAGEGRFAEQRRVLPRVCTF